MKAIKELAPQMRRKESTFRQMMEFFLCISLLWIVAAIFYAIKSGLVGFGAVLLNGVVAMAFSVLADALFFLPSLFKKEGKITIQEYGYKILHSYSFVTGLLLALLCPIGIRWWQLGLTSFLSTFVMKLLFGGFGANIMNPAVFGRVFAQLAFTSDMKTSTSTIETGASLTGGLSDLANGTAKLSDNFSSLLLGDYFGSLGETFTILLIVIAVYLSIRHIIDWRTPVFYIGALFLAYVVMFLCAGDGLSSFKDALSYTLVGGIFFGGILCLTDPVTSPTSRSGRIAAALFAAIFTFILRRYAKLPEGVAYSILITNFFTPLIDKMIKGRTRDHKIPLAMVLTLGGILLVLALVNGFINPMSATN